MEMPDFLNYRYIAITHDPFSAHWIEPKGRLRQAGREEVDGLEPPALERVASPEAIGLNYHGRDELAIYRVARVA